MSVVASLYAGPSRPPRHARPLRATLSACVLALAVLGPTVVPAAPAAAQTINGTLMDLDTGQPIDLGLVLMFTEEGDSVAMTVTDEDGRFTVTSPEPGSFVLLASALGYEETPAGVFELGAGGVMNVEYRIEPRPLPVDELVVSIESPVLQHRLVRNGFVRRFQRGLGVFVTPHDIEEAAAVSTEDLLRGKPGIRVADVQVLNGEARDSGAVILPRTDVGETVQIQGPGGGWCTPTLYVDGMRTPYSTDPTGGALAVTLSTVVPLSAVEAMEVYRRAAEIPVEYSPGAALQEGSCGVLVVWTRHGPTYAAPSRRAEAPTDGDEPRPLPEPDDRGSAPVSGERIRLQLDPGTSEGLGLASPWEGTFLEVRDERLIGNDPVLGRAVGVPLSGVEALHVQRRRAGIHAFKKGAIAGAAFGLGMWKFLDVICGERCGSGVKSAWFPASIGGVVMGFLVGARGPGTHWVEAPLPEPGTLPEPRVRTLLPPGVPPGG